ncbi:MAG: MBL fold metallo-hydrolase [Elusimicrobiota bacterium]
MRIKFWGCRGSIPVPDGRMIKYGGNTTCVEVNIAGKTLIIDAGTGIRKLGEELIAKKVKDIEIFLTHSHWDHIQGFPFFKPVYEEDCNIRISGCTNSYKQIRDILTKQMSYEFFPVRFSDLKSKITFVEGEFQTDLIEGYSMKTIEANHPIYTLGVRIDCPGGAFVFITDNELHRENARTTWDEFVEFSKGADYLIHDAQFTEAEYESRKGWGHSAFEHVIELAINADVKNLGFFHHDPDRKDSMLDDIEKKFKKVCKQRKCLFNIFAVKEHSGIDLSGG